MTEEDKRAFERWIEQGLAEADERMRLLREGKLKPVKPSKEWLDAKQKKIRAAS